MSIADNYLTIRPLTKIDFIFNNEHINHYKEKDHSYTSYKKY